jgi:hypothetical protein
VGERDSSLTRVQPVFDALLKHSPDGASWLGELWDMAASTRLGMAVPRPDDLGRLLAGETPADPAARRGILYERPVAPPAAFLRWLLLNPGAMQVVDRVDFGAKSAEARAWRGRLFSDEERLVREAQEEGLKQLERRLAQRGRRKWWAFEGFSRVDCCLITERCVLFVEGKRTDTVSSSTRWLEKRSQLWRNVEAAREFAGGKQFGVILAVEDELDGSAALDEAMRSLGDSYPHLESGECAELSRHLIGFVTWPDVVRKCGLPADCLIDRVVRPPSR